MSHHRELDPKRDDAGENTNRRKQEREDADAILGERAANIIGFGLMMFAAIVTAVAAKGWASFLFGPVGSIGEIYLRFNPRALLGVFELSVLTGAVLYSRKVDGEPLFPVPLVFGFIWLVAAIIRVLIE